MKILCTSIPALGHFHPMLPVAKALLAAGHKVSFAIAEDFAPEIVGEGFDHLAAGAGLDELVSAVEREVPDLPAGRKAAYMFTRLAPRSLLTPLLAIAREMRPDILLHEEGEHTAPLVAAMLGIPNVAIGWPSPMRPDDQLALLTRAMTWLWEEAGMVVPPQGGMFAHLFLDCCPPPLQTPFMRALPNARRFRPAVPPPPGTMAPAALNGLPSGPLVHATFGTVAAYNRADALYEAMITAVTGEPINLVLTVGRDNAFAASACPPNVRVTDYIPHADLLPRCDVLIGHGGCGSTIAALATGTPLIIIPRGGGAQFRNADACERAGAGRRLNSEDASPDRLRALMRELLDVPRYRAGARALSDEIGAMPDAADTVPVIAALAGQC